MFYDNSRDNYPIEMMMMMMMMTTTMMIMMMMMVMVMVMMMMMMMMMTIRNVLEEFFLRLSWDIHPIEKMMIVMRRRRWRSNLLEEKCRIILGISTLLR